MSQQQYKKALEQEIRKLNERIDMKILRGEHYGAESRRHKLLLRRMRAYSQKSFLSRVFFSLS